MSVKIGHASRDENLRASGGKAGDQDGKEVCIRDWYSGGWNVVLRPKSAAVAARMAAFCEAVCANSHVGYDQFQRNTLRVEARKVGFDGNKIANDCETDCSAFMTVCAEAGGVDMSAAYISGNAPTTWTMRMAFAATGAFDVLIGDKFTGRTALLQRGDILVRESGHTAMVLTNGEMATPTISAALTADTYTVKSGDTLWGIAQKCGSTVEKLAAANGIECAECAVIYPGQVLKFA